MQVLDVVLRNSGIRANFVDEFGDRSNNGGGHFRRFLFVESRLGVKTVALRKTAGR